MKKLLIGLIRLYQRTISAKTPPSCRFTPTCSNYAIQAIERFGLIRGSGLAIWRILRCNPFGKYGYDPVPEKKPRRVSRRKSGKAPDSAGAGESETPAGTPAGESSAGESGGETLPPADR